MWAAFFISNMNVTAPHARKMSRSVSFAACLCEIYLMPYREASRAGLTLADLESGKRASKAHRIRYPTLPKFTFFDDDAMASAVHEAACTAYAAATAELATAPPSASQLVTIKPGLRRRRSSRTSPGDYASPNPSTLVASAVAAATAAAAAKWREPPISESEPRMGRWFRRNVDSEDAIDEELMQPSPQDVPRFRLQRYDSVQDAVTRFSRLAMPAKLRGYSVL